MTETSENKVAGVTGASSGIGAVYADRLAKLGYDLVLVARRADRLETLAKKLNTEHGRQAEVLVADLEDESGLVQVERLLSSNCSIQVLVNNAGVARFAPIAIALTQDSVKQIALNVTALSRLTHAALPGFVARNQGVIINIASALALHSLPISAVYSGTKAFVLAFSRGLQAELATTNVKVQVVLPAVTATEIWDRGGVPLSALDASTVMSVDNLVDAALAGYASGETVTIPALADAQLWENFDARQSELFAATRTGQPAPRYSFAQA